MSSSGKIGNRSKRVKRIVERVCHAQTRTPMPNPSHAERENETNKPTKPTDREMPMIILCGVRKRPPLLRGGKLFPCNNINNKIVKIAPSKLGCAVNPYALSQRMSRANSTVTPENSGLSSSSPKNFSPISRCKKNCANVYRRNLIETHRYLDFAMQPIRFLLYTFAPVF